MVIGIGCDIVDHQTVEKMHWQSDLRISSRIFSVNELKLLPPQLSRQVSFLAGRFAAKEAILKCLGTGMIDGIALNEIEVLSDTSSCPKIFLKGEIEKIAAEKGITCWHVSISHTNSTSIAYALAECK